MEGNRFSSPISAFEAAGRWLELESDFTVGNPVTFVNPHCGSEVEESGFRIFELVGITS